MRQSAFLFAFMAVTAQMVNAAEAVAPAKVVVVPAGRESEYEKYHYAPAVRVGDTLVLSGIPAGGPGTFQEQVRRMFQRVEKTMLAAGATMNDIVEIQTFHANVKNSDDFQREVDEFLIVHKEFLPAYYPAWTAIGNTVLFSKSAVLEMRVMAVIGSGKNARVDRVNATEQADRPKTP
jgi:enamine deaminase RidA (YjgF/YER057c/UK114 family)